MDKKCNLCPRQCGVNRDKKVGACGMSNTARIALTMLHNWEEPIISGTKGSGTIFFSGCNLKCNYCQNYDVSHRGKGYDISDRELAECFKRLEADGAHNINLVTPNHYVENIINALNIYRPNIPICYNTSGYDSIETVRRLIPFVDIFLTDFKYGISVLAHELSGAENYFDVASEAVKLMRMAKPDIIVDGLMKQGIIIRHLVLPGEMDNSIKVIDWLAENISHETIISLMSQYTPNVGESSLNRHIKPLEYKILCERLLKAGFENAYIQESGSGSDEYIPQFKGDCLY